MRCTRASQDDGGTKARVAAFKTKHIPPQQERQHLLSFASPGTSAQEGMWAILLVANLVVQKSACGLCPKSQKDLPKTIDKTNPVHYTCFWT